MAIPAVTCERCGEELPTEVIYIGPYDPYALPKDMEGHSICKKCRKSFKRWLRRLGRRK